MEVPLQAYFFLTNSGVLQPDEAPDVNLHTNSVLLSPEQTEMFVSGHGVVSMLERINNVTRMSGSPASASHLKGGTSLAMYSYNWKYLHPYLQVSYALLVGTGHSYF